MSDTHTLIAIIVLLTILALRIEAAPSYDWKWRKGRASFYGLDAWSIHKGSCNYGYIYKDEPLGWDVAAVPDVFESYPDSCGTCIEVACDAVWIKDNYGQNFDRTHTCRDTNKTLVVRVTDTCPCTYPPNNYSNKRWCCGDVDHLDMSIWAFEKLAEERWGVIGVRYRPVPCDYKPENPLPPLPNPSELVPPPADAKRIPRPWPEYYKKAGDPLVIFDDKLGDSWSTADWKAWVQPLKDSSNGGMLGSQAICAKLYRGGALEFKTSRKGLFSDRIALEFWVYVGVTGWEGTAAQVPNIRIALAGEKGGCRSVRIYDSKPDTFQPRCKPYCVDYWWRWVFYFKAFQDGQPGDVVINNSDDFSGCGGMSDWDITSVQFRNEAWGEPFVCFDRIQLI